jgi:hypothetical protein
MTYEDKASLWAINTLRNLKKKGETIWNNIEKNIENIRKNQQYISLQ